MTITPTPLLPAPAGGTTSAAAGSGKGEQQVAAAGFGALLAQLSAAALSTGKAAGQPTPPAGAGTASGTDLVEGETSEESAPAAELLLAGSAGVAVTAPLDPATKAGVGQPTNGMPTVGAEASLAETAVRGVAPAGTAPAQPGTTVVGTAALGEALTTEIPPEGPLDVGAQPTAATVTAAGNEGGPQAQSAAQPSAVAGTTPSASPVMATGASVAAGAATTAPGVTASPLLDQVTPVVSRMVSAGEGSHRMVLRLHPADLGEVQLTVTVRGESVDVTVAAGTEAREMLAGGSSELRALLDSIGRTAGQITFRELPGAGQLQQPSMGLATGGQPDAGQAGTSYGDLSGRGDSERDGRGRSDRAAADAPRDHRTEPTTSSSSTTNATPGSGALDVRI